MTCEYRDRGIMLLVAVTEFHFPGGSNCYCGHEITGKLICCARQAEND